jgi:predicted exporter
VFEPFVKDVEATRRGLTLRSEDLQGTALGVKVRSLLVQQNRDWFAFIPLHDVADPAALARTAGAWAHDVARAEERGVARAGERGVARAEDRGVQFLDLKAEANRLIAGYRGQSLRLTALGFCAIAAVLLTGLRSPGATLRVLGPVVAATLLAVACLRLSGLRLTLFHLVALLLVIGVGVNYALFFNQPESDARSRRLTTLSLCVCCGTTLCAFGALATSSMPVLHALGVTVSVGIVFSFLLAAVFAPFHASNTEEHGRADRAI